MRLRSIIMPVLFATVCAVGCSAHGTPTSEPNLGVPVQVEPDNPSYYTPGVTTVTANDIDFRITGCSGLVAIADLDFSVSYTGDGELGVLVGSNENPGAFYTKTLNVVSGGAPIAIPTITLNNAGADRKPHALVVHIMLVGGSVHQIYEKILVPIPSTQCANGWHP
jgi:hypothetical protein